MGPQAGERQAVPPPVVLREVRAGRQLGEVGGATTVVGAPVRVDGPGRPNQKVPAGPVEETSPQTVPEAARAAQPIGAGEASLLRTPLVAASVGVRAGLPETRRRVLEGPPRDAKGGRPTPEAQAALRARLRVVLREPPNARRLQGAPLAPAQVGATLPTGVLGVRPAPSP